MSHNEWMMLAFAAGLASPILCRKGLRWAGGLLLLALPLLILTLFDDRAFSGLERGAEVHALAWFLPACLGVTAGTIAVVLRIVR